MKVALPQSDPLSTEERPVFPPAPAIVQSGGEFFDLLIRLIQSANRAIHLQTYILADDETGNRVAEELSSAARRGLAVHVVVDGYASQALPSSFRQRLTNAGIHFRFFDPIWSSKYLYFGRRLHHKVLVVDHQRALVGGINVANHYNDTPAGAPWLDFALYVEGSVCRFLADVCVFRTKRNSFLKRSPAFPAITGPSGSVRILVNDWVRGKKQITHYYLSMIRNSRKRVTILSSYFLPGKQFRRALAEAARRGVHVRVIVAGISDVKLAKFAERYMYQWLLHHGIEVYEYQPRILHGKVGVADGEVVTIGSYNINNISARASIELNLGLTHTPLSQELETRLDVLIKRDCEQITHDRYKKMSTPVQRFLQRSAYDIFRATLYLFTFYFRQRE